MRVTSDLWVSALTRRIFSRGGFAAIARRGAADAGAIFIIVRDRLGDLRLYAPAAQTSYDDANPEERRFSLVMESMEEGEVASRLEREGRFDSDVWVVEIEAADEPDEGFFPVTTP